jgi:hypothetical protein|tara:strand:+ start:1257 stop:1637 length:381 start_codon:yes stop_codon:yes gene_type:complete
MPIVQYTFTNPINVSLQAKPTSVATGVQTGAWDSIYFVNIVSGKQSGTVKLVGECVSINNSTKTISVNSIANIPLPNTGDYLFFAKNTSINTSGIMGYYAEVEMINDSTEQAELFTVSSEVSESSK